MVIVSLSKFVSLHIHILHDFFTTMTVSVPEMLWGHLCGPFLLKWFNTLRPRQNGRHFADDTFNYVFMNENVRISIKFSLKFVPKVPINNIPALVQILAWRRIGDKPLSEPMMVNFLRHICVTRPQLIPAWRSNCNHGEITISFPKFNGATIEVWELVSYFNTRFLACD